MRCQNLNVSGNFASMIVACFIKPAEARVLIAVNTGVIGWDI